MMTTMKRYASTQSEMAGILVWESSFPTLTADQQSICVVLHRHSGPIQEDELAACLNCTVDELRLAKRGIHGILVDANSRDYWIR